MSDFMKKFETKMQETEEGYVRGGRVWAKASEMGVKSIDYSAARKWSPNFDFMDETTHYPSEVEKHGVLPQAKLLELHANNP